MYKETWYIKRKSDSKPEEVVLFFRDKIFADVAHNKAVKNKDAQIMFGNDFPKEIASAWQ